MNNDLKCQSKDEEEIREFDELYPSVKYSLQKIISQEGYTRHSICKKIISAEGGNCFGILYEINIKGETAEGNEKETNIFVKHVIPNSDTVKLLSVSEIYSKEVFVYTELANIFTNLQNTAKIPLNKRYKLAKIYDDSNIDAIMLENMRKRGFKTYNKFDEMELNYAKLCVENLAKFHALGFVIEKIMPEYFERKIKSMKQSLVIGATYKVFANNVYKIVTTQLPSGMKFKVDAWWERALEAYSKYVHGTMTDVKCICHGDYKTNNIMYKETNGKMTEVIAVDYQLAHYGSPVLDFIYFICMGTDQTFRRMHLEYLKDHYHISLKKYLEYFNMLVDDIYPKKMFEKDFKDCIDFALVTCICVMPFILSADGEEPDFMDSDIVSVGIKVDKIYYERLNGIFYDFFEQD